MFFMQVKILVPYCHSSANENDEPAAFGSSKLSENLELAISN